MAPGPLGAYIWYYLQESKPASIRALTPERHNLLLSIRDLRLLGVYICYYQQKLKPATIKALGSLGAYTCYDLEEL